MFKKFLSIALVILVVSLQGCGASSRDSGDSNSISSSSINAGKLVFKDVKSPQYIEGVTQERGHYQEIVQPLEVPKQYESLAPLQISDNYTMYENGRVSQEGKINVIKSKNNFSNEMMLLLDFSGSIVDGGCEDENTTCSQLIKQVEVFIDNVVAQNNIALSIYYFNASNEIYPLDRTTKYPSTSINDLKNAIDKLRDPQFMDQLQDYTYSTNLYGGVEKATEKLCLLSGCDSKDDEEQLYIRSIVIFTDGRDSANVVSKSDMLKNLRKDKIEYYTMGIGEADKSVLQQISGRSNYFYSVDNFESIFSRILKTIEIKSNFFIINFCPSTKGGGSIDVKFLYDDQAGIKTFIPEQKVNLIDRDFACDIN